MTMFKNRESVLRTAVGFVVAFMLAGSPARAADTLKEVERLQFADGLYGREMWDLAIKEYQAYIRDFPKGTRLDVAHFRLGESLKQRKDFDGAEKAFGVAFRDYPAGDLRFKAGLKLADLLVERGRQAPANEVLRALLKGKPPAEEAAAALYSLGDGLAKLNETEEAIPVLEAVRKEHPKSEFQPYATLRLAGLYAGRSTDAAASMEKALVLYRELAAGAASGRLVAEALFRMGDLHFRLKAHDKSAEAYKTLMARFPKDPRADEARLQAGWASHHAGLHTDALQIADAALGGGTLDEKARAEWLYLKANSERQLLKQAEAVKTYTELLGRAPGAELENPARYEMAVTLYQMGRHADAVGAALKVELPGDSMKDVYWLLAESYAALKKVDEAIQYYRLIVRKFPKSDRGADATYRLARHLQAKESFKEASRYYRQAAADYPDSKLAAQALFASAFCLSRQGMDEEAVRDWKALVERYPADALVEQALHQKAMHEIRLKRDADALASLDAFLKAFGKSALLGDAHYWRGLLLKDQGKLEEAEADLRQAVKPGIRAELRQDATYHLAVVLQKRGQADAAAALYQEVLGSPLRDKLSADLLQWLSERRFEAGKPDDALRAARALVEKTKDAAWQQIGWCLAGRAQAARGDAQAAREAFGQALKIKARTPLMAEAALRLGELDLAAGDARLAAERFTLAADSATDDERLGIRARAYVGLGRSARVLKDPAGAGRYFMSVAILFDDPEIVPDCLAQAAEAFREGGQADLAKQAEQELIKRFPESPQAKRARKGGAAAPGK